VVPIRDVLRAAILTVVLVASGLTGCQRPTIEQCERLCWRYNELKFWEKFEADAAELAPDAREKLRAERKKVWEEMRAREFDPGLENCIRACRRASSPKDVKCVDEAKTSAQAEDCAGLERSKK
jgi:hypothetical protein